jgi:hypothetical protein
MLVVPMLRAGMLLWGGRRGASGDCVAHAERGNDLNFVSQSGHGGDLRAVDLLMVDQASGAYTYSRKSLRLITMEALAAVLPEIFMSIAAVGGTVVKAPRFFTCASSTFTGIFLILEGVLHLGIHSPLAITNVFVEFYDIKFGWEYIPASLFEILCGVVLMVFAMMYSSAE